MLPAILASAVADAAIAPVATLDAATAVIAV
nr:MAG TPA: hypothetical protein [Caudoviricetes sp.]